MAKIKIRIANGTPPFSVVLKNNLNATVYTTSSDSDEISIPDNIVDLLANGLTTSVVDSVNNLSTLGYDGVTLSLMKKYWVGRSVANGGTGNHITAMFEGESLGFNYTGVIFNADQFESDAQFNTFLNASPFDHTQPVPSSPEFPFDEVVSQAFHMNTCKHLKVGIWLGRDHNKMNNGTTSTLFMSTNDLGMRPDGVTPTQRTGPGPVPTFLVLSYSSTAALQYAQRMVHAFFKRYLAAINDGTIAFVGFPIGSSGEAEYPVFYMYGFDQETVNGTQFSAGDFHPESISKFKAKFPEYSSLTNNDLAYGGGTPRLKFRWHLTDEMNKFERAIGQYVINNFPGLTRVKWMQHDVGSFVDELSGGRLTMNSAERINPWSFLFKSNDDPVNRSNNTLNFILDDISSLARKAGGIALVEPSPYAGDFNDGINRAYVLTELQLAYQGGRAGISWVTSQAHSNISQLMTSSGIVVGSLPQPKTEFKIVGSNKELWRHTIALSSVMNGGGLGAYQNSYQIFKTDNSLSMVDTIVIDDLKPVIDDGCVSGPTLNSILNPTQTSLTFQFDGIDVESIAWRIKQGSALLRQGVISPSNSTPSITYSLLPEGNYTLEIEGESCQSNISFDSFTITSFNFGPITTHLNNNISDYNGDVLFDIRKNTETVYQYTQGAYDRNDQVPVMSLSKAVTAATLLALIDEGLLTLNTTVGSLISSWNSGPRANITLKQIIAHTSGIPDNTDNEGDPTLEQYVNDLASVPLNFTPGTQFSYSTTAYQVAARMAEVVTGQTWKQVFESRIRSKCEMGTAEYNPASVPVTGNPNQPNAGYGLYCTQEEYSNFYQMLRQNGVYESVAVLSPAAIEIMFADQTGGLGPWGFGIIRNDSGNEPTSESATGSYAWINRAKGISCVLFTQSTFEDTIAANNQLREIVRTVFDDEPVEGDIQPILADFGYPDHLNIEWEVISNQRYATDTSTVTAPSGYHIWYLIGDEIIITDTPLYQKLWASDNIFHIEKCLIKDGVDDLYFWGVPSTDPVWRPEDGSPMSGNTSVAYQTWIFN